ncbi:MAG: hypothetical protein QT02_C0002G0070 [archaeon GW2011_AR9]|nr:MAG: hypothetical protein QT02_C0002G0070 [archaeon GW2011_AR9]HIH12476.1 hypothetical protein [Candidatus Woesearchaeota archaeon]
MKRNFPLVVLTLVLLILPFTAGLSLVGKKISPITYLPGTTLSADFSVSGTDFPIEVLVDGGVFKHITISEVKNNQFTFTINFSAENQIPPGNYNIGLTVREVPEKIENGISAVISASKSFEVIVYSFQKDINPVLSIPNINQGSKLTLYLSVNSMGYPNIDKIYGDITLYDAENKQIGRVITEEKPLEGLKGMTLTSSFNSSSLPTGRYSANAVVFYDGQSKKANTTFLIGNMDVILENYTSEVEQGYAEFAVQVRNNWGNSLRHVYAKVMVNNQELLQTPSLDLEPWASQQLKGIMKVDQEPGIYPGVIHLFYEGESKEFPFQLVVTKAPVVLAEPVLIQQQIEEAKSFSFIPALIVGLLFVVVIAIYLFKQNYCHNLGTRKEDDF